MTETFPGFLIGRKSVPLRRCRTRWFVGTEEAKAVSDAARWGSEVLLDQSEIVFGLLPEEKSGGRKQRASVWENKNTKNEGTDASALERRGSHPKIFRALRGSVGRQIGFAVLGERIGAEQSFARQTEWRRISWSQ